jgi:hypothetical protein
MVIVEKFPPSSLTYARTLTFNPYVVNTSFICNGLEMCIQFQMNQLLHDQALNYGSKIKEWEQKC